MIVRLQNLSARAPVVTDVQAVTHLLRLCDAADAYQSTVTEEDILSAWQARNFTLRKDAWVIVTNKGRIAAYADVRQDENEGFSSSLYVHPDYRGRGIGTLLIWLVEERARQLALDIRSSARIGLRITANSVNIGAQHLLEREGYTRVHSFWHLMLDKERMFSSSMGESSYQNGKFTTDMGVDEQSAINSVQLQERVGLDIARQYDVYEKELLSRSPIIEAVCEDMCYTA